VANLLLWAEVLLFSNLSKSEIGEAEIRGVRFGLLPTF